MGFSAPASNTGLGGHVKSYSDIDTKILGERGQAALIALTYRFEFPLTVMAIKLTEDHGSFGRCILRQVIASQFLLIVVIDRTDKAVSDHAKILFTLFRFINCHGKNHFFGSCINFVEMDQQLFVITVTFADDKRRGIKVKSSAIRFSGVPA